MKAPICLTIAGSDPSGGAGIQGDLKAFSALGAYGMAAITGLTIQNTTGVESSWPVPPHVVARQVSFLFEDLPPGAVKTGMLGSTPIVQAVAATMADFSQVPLVVDPVMVATSGATLLEYEALEALRSELLVLATVVTPNHPEAEALIGEEIRTVDEMKTAALRIAELGPRHVLLKGGDFQQDGNTVVDIWTDGNTLEVLESPRVRTRNTHGSGCALAAAICVGLAEGLAPREAMLKGRHFVQQAILNSLTIGRGPGPVNHLGLE